MRTTNGRPYGFNYAQRNILLCESRNARGGVTRLSCACRTSLAGAICASVLVSELPDTLSLDYHQAVGLYIITLLAWISSIPLELHIISVSRWIFATLLLIKYINTTKKHRTFTSFILTFCALYGIIYTVRRYPESTIHGGGCSSRNSRGFNSFFVSPRDFEGRW